MNVLLIFHRVASGCIGDRTINNLTLLKSHAESPFYTSGRVTIGYRIKSHRPVIITRLHERLLQRIKIIVVVSGGIEIRKFRKKGKQVRIVIITELRASVFVVKYRYLCGVVTVA